MQAPESARHTIDTTESVQTVLLGLYDPKIATLFAEAISADASIRAVEVSHADEVHEAAARGRLSVAILEHGPGHDALAMSAKIAADRVSERRRMPVLVVSDREYPGGEQAGITEWLVKPFSSAYAQAKVQAWVHRGASRWQKAPVPADEERRMATLRALRLLDTPPEPRFDRLTRLASRFFAVPIALIAFVDRDRQWFKSSVGINVKETSRDSAFAAHVVVNRTTLVVNDALLDDRFAENPLVIAEPRVRFYAGAPLILLDGTCIGTLSLLDTRTVVRRLRHPAARRPARPCRQRDRTRADHDANRYTKRRRLKGG
jgi:DNA-binding response OmpR family regulator